MIISASRRTDIPAFYSEWFFHRLNEGFAEVKNPFNPNHLKMVSLKPNDVDCIVFWTKNPEPMIDRLEKLKDYSFYFQFTLNPYGKDIEQNVPSKHKYVINSFRRLAEKVGKQRIIWRYDPVLITEKYSVDYHLEWFEKLADELNGCFYSCVISFIDNYSKTEKRFIQNGIRVLTNEEEESIAKHFSQVGKRYGFDINTCAEKIDLSKYNIGHSCCISKEHIEKITGKILDYGKDKYQRAECGCCGSTDIGVYNTCIHECVYCYANASNKTVEKNFTAHDPYSFSL